MKPDLASATDTLHRDLVAQGVHVRRNVPTAELSTWRIGGPADLVAEPGSVGDVQAIVRAVRDARVPVTVIGDGSNLLFDDAGHRGLIVRIGSRMSALRIHMDGTVEAEAGIWVPRFAAAIGRAGFAGCAHAVGIPGTLGGLILMNGGSQRRGIGEHLVSARVVTSDGEVAELDHDACRFAYRRSALQDLGAVVVGGRFRYAAADAGELRREMLAILADRNRKFPRKLPNCGSTFLSDPAMYATVGPPGKAIEECGLKGLRRGGAQISPLHANFIVNTGGATSADVLWLIAEIRRRVAARTGHLMDCEVRHVGPDGRLRPAHLAAEERWPEPLGAVAAT